MLFQHWNPRFRAAIFMFRRSKNMRYKKLLGCLGLLVGIAAIPAVAQDGYWQRRNIYNDRQDLRNDYATVNDLRAHIAEDRARMDEHIRCGNDQAAAADAADLARHHRVPHALPHYIQSATSNLHPEYP